MGVFARFAGIIALIALLVGVGLVLLRPQTPSSEDGGANGTNMAGQMAPAFELRNLQGGTVSLASLKGKAVVVNFWASWCPPCRDEAPILNQAALKYSQQGVVILGIVYNDTAEAAKAFAQEYKLGFPILLDNETGKRAAIDYGLISVPETFFVDTTGKIRFRHIGPVNTEMMDEKISELLKG
jgi:cytochrome c biogenesis protein CcmG, thiol:disulfide interchange protein DsbE